MEHVQFVTLISVQHGECYDEEFKISFIKNVKTQFPQITIKSVEIDSFIHVGYEYIFILSTTSSQLKIILDNNETFEVDETARIYID